MNKLQLVPRITFKSISFTHNKMLHSFFRSSKSISRGVECKTKTRGGLWEQNTQIPSQEPDALNSNLTRRTEAFGELRLSPPPPIRLPINGTAEIPLQTCSMVVAQTYCHIPKLFIVFFSPSSPLQPLFSSFFHGIISILNYKLMAVCRNINQELFDGYFHHPSSSKVHWATLSIIEQVEGWIVSYSAEKCAICRLSPNKRNLNNWILISKC